MAASSSSHAERRTRDRRDQDQITRDRAARIRRASPCVDRCWSSCCGIRICGYMGYCNLESDHQVELTSRQRNDKQRQWSVVFVFVDLFVKPKPELRRHQVSLSRKIVPFRHPHRHCRLLKPLRAIEKELRPRGGGAWLGPRTR